MFIAGLPKQHFDDVIKSIVKSVPGETITGLPAIGSRLLSADYIVECFDTLEAFHAGRPNCFDRGLCVIGVAQTGESFSSVSEHFFPFALTSEVRFPRTYSSSPSQSRRDKNELSRFLEAHVKRQVRIRNDINQYLQSRTNRTPMLLPLRHFGEKELDSAVKAAWQTLPHSKAPVAELEAICKDFEERFPFSKRSGRSGLFANSRDIWFTLPGRDLHASAHSEAIGHAKQCFLNGVLRVGAAIRQGFHYDCTKKGDKHSGTFSNCHGETVTKSGKPHLNVYPNDFIR